MKTEFITCAYCGNPFEGKVYAKRKFCSHLCYSLAKKQPVDRICRTCGNHFQTIAGEIRKGGGHYCSRKCFFIGNSGSNNPAWVGGDIVLTCRNCYTEFTRPRTWPRSGTKTFCSESCRAAFMRANPDQTPNWKNGATPVNEQERKSWRYLEWRASVFERDNYTCQICGERGGRLHAHHLYKFSEFPELRYVTQNGHTLCRDCHLSLKNNERDYLIKLGYNPDDTTSIAAASLGGK